MIEKTIERWHQVVSGRAPELLDELLDDDVVFLSPVVFTPQKGKAITALYLRAAANTLGGGSTSGGSKPSEAEAEAGASGAGGFRYTREVMQGNTAVLEFETQAGGKYVNGVDIITCNDEGRIVEFRVMIRPLQAVNAVHAQMRAMLEKLQDAGGESAAGGAQ